MSADALPQTGPDSVRRGGPQRIPRPPGARPGAEAPWSALTAAERAVDLAALREALEGWRSPQVPRPDGRLAAVLVPLYVEQDEASVILTRRAVHLRTHSREVSFPGGGHELGDADLWATALREAQEETGLDPASVVRIGVLAPLFTVGSDSLVHPYVAELPEGRPAGLRPDPAEVERILHVPLSQLLDPAAYRQELWPRDGHLRPINFFEIPGDTVWGATASILLQLLQLATGTDRPYPQHPPQARPAGPTGGR